jgi:hypothetical protein
MPQADGQIVADEVSRFQVGMVGSVGGIGPGVGRLRDCQEVAFPDGAPPVNRDAL